MLCNLYITFKILKQSIVAILVLFICPWPTIFLPVALTLVSRFRKYCNKTFIINLTLKHRTFKWWMAFIKTYKKFWILICHSYSNIFFQQDADSFGFKYILHFKKSSWNIIDTINETCVWTNELSFSTSSLLPHFTGARKHWTRFGSMNIGNQMLLWTFMIYILFAI